MPSTQPLPEIRPPFYRPPPWPGPWLALNAACGFAFGCWVVARRNEPALALLLAMFVPAIVSLLVGQDSLILLAAITGVFLLLESRWPVLAGLLLALLWVKFQFLPAFLLLLIVRKEWRALAGFAAGSAAILLPYAGEIGGYVTRLRQMAGRADVVPCRECMPNLYAFIPSFGVAAFVSVGLLILTATQLRRRPLPSAFALAAVTALLASMHAHGYDCGLLFLAVTLGPFEVRELAPALAPRSLLRARCEQARSFESGRKLPHSQAILAGWALSPLPYLLPYFGNGAWTVAARLLPAATATLLWLTLLQPWLFLPDNDESPRVPDECRTA
jgi:hypothetical protein